jgi:hypothetical protein
MVFPVADRIIANRTFTNPDGARGRPFADACRCRHTPEGQIFGLTQVNADNAHVFHALLTPQNEIVLRLQWRQSSHTVPVYTQDGRRTTQN